MKYAKVSVMVAAVVLGGGARLWAAQGTHLHAAIARAELRRAEAMLAAAPELAQTRTEQGQTPLHLAVQGNHLDLVDRLLALGVAVDARDRQGNTPLHIAAARFRKEAVRRLIAAGAEVNATNAAGLTPLGLAAASGPDADEVDHLLAATAEALLAGGATVNAQDHTGLTPLDHALRRGHARLAELLRTHGGVRGGAPLRAPGERVEYTPYSQIGPRLLQAENDYPAICKRYDLGLSHEARNIWAVRISDNVLVEEDEPEFKYISTMHGDEIVGLEMCLHLIDHLLVNYGTDPQVTDLVDQVEIWIVPLMNPTGTIPCRARAITPWASI